MRNSKQAIEWARREIKRPSRNWYRWCQMFVRMSLDLPGGTPDAGKAWDWAKYKHRTSNTINIPAGVPVFWEMPSVADHVALSTGNGKCISTDILRKGKVDEVTIASVTRAWGGYFLGWTEDLNGKRVWSGAIPAPTNPKRRRVILRDVVEAARKDPNRKQGGVTYPGQVKVIERALKDEGLLAKKYAADGSFGSLTVRAYAKWQRRLGYLGRDADGIPGGVSLLELGKRHGFTVDMK